MHSISLINKLIKIQDVAFSLQIARSFSPLCREPTAMYSGAKFEGGAFAQKAYFEDVTNYLHQLKN